MSTLAEIVTACGELRPSVFGSNHITGWVNEIEQRVVEEVINRAKGNDVEFVPYNYELDSETELKAPDGVYTAYVFAKEDYTLGDIARYNNDAAMAEAEFYDFAKRYRREHYPK